MTDNPRPDEPWSLIPKSEQMVLVKLLEEGPRTATELSKGESYATVYEALSRLEVRQFVVRDRTRFFGGGRRKQSRIARFYSLTFAGFLAGMHLRLSVPLKRGDLEAMIEKNAGIHTHDIPDWDDGIRTLFGEWRHVFASNRKLSNWEFKRAVEATFVQLDAELRRQDALATTEQRENSIPGRPRNLRYLYLEQRFIENLIMPPDMERRSWVKDERRFAKWMKMLAKSGARAEFVDVMWRRENEARRTWEVTRVGSLALGEKSSWTEGDEKEILSRYSDIAP